MVCTNISIIRIINTICINVLKFILAVKLGSCQVKKSRQIVQAVDTI